jgi:hypothetical protein
MGSAGRWRLMSLLDAILGSLRGHRTHLVFHLSCRASLPGQSFLYGLFAHPHACTLLEFYEVAHPA